MPGLKGVDALPALRALASDTRVIMVSGVSDEATGERALAPGGFDFVRKAVDLAFVDVLQHTGQGTVRRDGH